MTRQNSWNFDNTYTTGDVLYASDTSTLTKLSPGTNGHVLQVSSGVPVWGAAPAGSASWTLLDTYNISNDIPEFTTGLNTTFDLYVLDFVFVQVDYSTYPGYDIQFRISSDGGTTYGSYYSVFQNEGSATDGNIFSWFGGPLLGQLYFTFPGTTDRSSFWPDGNFPKWTAANYTTTSTFNAIEISVYDRYNSPFSSGNPIQSGELNLYGITTL